MTETKVLMKKRFATAAAWHSWLEKHHASSPPVLASPSNAAYDAVLKCTVQRLLACEITRESSKVVSIPTIDKHHGDQSNSGEVLRTYNVEFGGERGTRTLDLGIMSATL